MSGRAAVEVKADGLLLQGRVRVLEVMPGRVRAEVRGGSGTWQCGWRPGGWWCACPAPDGCSHLVAVRRVVAVVR